MVEINDTTTEDTRMQPQAAPAAAPADLSLDKTSPHPVQVKGLFNTFTSAYWAFAIPLLGFARYASEAVFEHLKWNDADKPRWKNRAQATVAGTVMALGAGFFLERTYKDMRNEFAESLAWEFGKKPEEVNMADIMHSKNKLVQDAKNNYIKYNARRFAVILPFFADYFGKQVARLGGPFESLKKIHSKTAVAAGTASVSAYLVSDVVGRKESFFERLQKLHRNKINQTDTLGERITTNDLINLHARAVQDKHPENVPQMGTPEWRNDEILFGRIADLMNQTYGNESVKEHANFGLSKFIYMVGMGLLKSESLEKNLAYVEVANRYGIPAVEQLSRAVNGGGHAALEAALNNYPEVKTLCLKDAAELAPAKTFADESLRKVRPEMLAATHAERAAQKTDGAAVGM